jgi:hypothetical protein
MPDEDMLAGLAVIDARIGMQLYRPNTGLGMFFSYTYHRFDMQHAH